MIKARHTPWFQKVFNVYITWAFRRNFHQMQIIGDVKDKGLPILAIGNHISWWDGFWILALNDKLFRRRFHVMMLEEQLRKNLFLSKLGAFSIKRKSKSASQSIRYAGNLLRSKNNFFLLFPQGEIQSQHQFPIVFEKGWERILLQKDNPIQILMIANLIDYQSFRKPVLKQYIFSPEKTSNFTCGELEAQYNVFYKDCIQNQIQNI
ncbi:MAG: lysophospholipid acyltransferase family protein [Bacteroidales bacterium]